MDNHSRKRWIVPPEAGSYEVFLHSSWSFARGEDAKLLLQRRITMLQVSRGLKPGLRDKVPKDFGEEYNLAGLNTCNDWTLRILSIQSWVSMNTHSMEYTIRARRHVLHGQSLGLHRTTRGNDPIHRLPLACLFRYVFPPEIAHIVSFPFHEVAIALCRCLTIRKLKVEG